MSIQIQRKRIFLHEFLSLRPTEVGIVCGGNKASAINFMRWKNPLLQLSKGNCFQTGKLNILQLG